MINIAEVGMRNNKVSIDFKQGQTLRDVLLMLYSGRLDNIINPDGSVKGFIKIYINESPILNINSKYLSNDDDIRIISSFSGG